MRVPVFVLLFLAAPITAAQDYDEIVTWRTYASERMARVRVFASEDERRPRTVVVDDHASNPTVVTDEAQYVADVIGRTIGFDPVEATFVFRFTAAAFVEDASARGKTLLLKAVFRRTSTGALGSPDWRVISSDALEDLTDRAMR
ncbi:hypothetical protein [Rubrivirga sp.]|uniref:hypothetical protein n=1 Tax=Rubrivirga sp. TaxID=1885344 RepID=UPI003C75E1F1